MKKIHYIKRALVNGAFLAVTLIVVSCTNDQKPEDTKVVAVKHNDAKFTNNNQEKDAKFLVNAAEINLKQIHLGQLAQQKGTSAHVKELGKTIENAHTKSQKDLTALAKSKMVTIPTSPTDDAKDAFIKLNKKTGSDFDKSYADNMVSNHKDAIEIFEKVTTDGNDADIKNWAIATLPDLRTHLNHSIECQNKLK